MAVFLCKTCGSALNVLGGEKLVKCDYCGVQQTIPKTEDDNIQALFKRANLLRIKNEFDKAESLYEKILVADEREAEAYWGVILCKYGIEYVEDPKTFKRIPTCHRTSYESIIADEYYKKTLEYADPEQVAVYEAEAREIDEIQKDIIAVSSKEKTYDVFICYKETDANGDRTLDSVIANDIYHQLTQSGFNVFYAAISLEDRLGSAYEPIIFSALNSSKVMLAIGTKSEYFNAVWVKNEWSRFLKLMKNDRSKLLIPCYRDMDAYELPDEFAHLQAQDMSKIGFMTDIVRGIGKVISANEQKNYGGENVARSNAKSTEFPTVSALVKNAYLFLDERNWVKAREYFCKAIELDPENVQAYLGNLMATVCVTRKEELGNCPAPFDGVISYKRLVRFADEELKKELDGYVKEIRDRLELQRKQRLKTKKYRIIGGLVAIFIAVLGYFVIYPAISVARGNYSVYINMYGIEEYKIKEGVTTIKYNSFSDCKKLKKVIIPYGVTGIGDYAFEGCESLMVVEIPDSVVSIGSGAFSNCTALTSINIPNGVTSIADRTFYECTELQTVYIPDSVTSIGDSAFYNCVQINRISIPDNVTNIGTKALYGCNGITAITIPGSVMRIGDYAFKDCYNLQSMIIPEGVKKVGQGIFSGCYNLRTINFGGTRGRWSNMFSAADVPVNCTVNYSFSGD